MIELEVFGTKTVSPFADTVRLVDNEERGPRGLDGIQTFGVGKLLGSHKEKFCLAAFGVDQGLLLLALGHQRIDDCGSSCVQFLEVFLLVSLQSDEGRYNDGGSVERVGRDLIDGRLSETRRHHDQSVAAFEHRGNRFLLARAEGFVVTCAFRELPNLRWTVFHGTAGSSWTPN